MGEYFDHNWKKYEIAEADNSRVFCLRLESPLLPPVLSSWSSCQVHCCILPPANWYYIVPGITPPGIIWWVVILCPVLVGQQLQWNMALAILTRYILMVRAEALVLVTIRSKCNNWTSSGYRFSRDATERDGSQLNMAVGWFYLDFLNSVNNGWCPWLIMILQILSDRKTF